MTIIVPQYTKVVRPVGNILRAMARLRTRRFRLELPRSEFLARWRKLRAELARTAEYREMRAAVKEREAGMCSSCGDPGTVVHHLQQVSFAPQHALDPRRATLLCRDCHREVHPWMNK